MNFLLFFLFTLALISFGWSFVCAVSYNEEVAKIRFTKNRIQMVTCYIKAKEYRSKMYSFLAAGSIPTALSAIILLGTIS